MGGAILGLGAIGLGQVYKSRSDDEAEKFRKAWENGETAVLDQAQNDFDTYRNLTYIGIGVLAVDGVLYFIKQRKQRAKNKKYRVFCSDKKAVSVHPLYSPSSELGFMLKINF